MLLRKLVVVGLVGFVCFAASFATAEDAVAPGASFVGADGVSFADPSDAFGDRFSLRVGEGAGPRFTNLAPSGPPSPDGTPDFRRYEVALVARAPAGIDVAFAQRGARVIVFEANPNASRRLAGEWLHPPGVEVLKRLGIDVAKDSPGSAPGQGFVVFPDDKSSPILLPYPDGMQGVSLEHESLVSLVRNRAAAHPNPIRATNSGSKPIWSSRRWASIQKRSSGC